MTTAPRQAGWLRTLVILIYSIYVTLKISLQYLIYSYYYPENKLRQKGNRLLNWWSQRLLNAIQLKFSVREPQHLQFDPTRRHIIMSNHCSFYDIPLVLLAAHNSTIRMITKQELFRLPIWGRALRSSEFIPLDRRNHRLALQQLRYAKQKMQSGIILWISPEGTRSKTGKLGPFKNGGFKLAKEMDAIITPIVINNNQTIFTKKRGHCLGISSVLKVCPPIDSRDFESPSLLRDKVHDAISQTQRDLEMLLEPIAESQLFKMELL